MEEVWTKQLPGKPVALSLFTLPLRPHQKNPALSVTQALARRTEGCCKPSPPSPAGPAATSSGHTRQMQSHKDSFGLLPTIQDVGFLVWQVPLPPPRHPVADHTWQIWHGWEDRQGVSRQGVLQRGVGRDPRPAAMPGSRHAAHFARVPFCYKPPSALAFEPAISQQSCHPEGRHSSAARTCSPIDPTDFVAELKLLKCLQKGLLATSTGCSSLSFLFVLSSFYILPA